MKSCSKCQKNLALYIYDELNPVERADVEAHLQVCSQCSAELQELRHLQTEIPAQSLIDPDEATLKVLRNAVSQKIRVKAKPKRQWLPIPFIKPTPAFQYAFALVLIVLGFLAGRQTSSTITGNNDLTLQTLFTANRQVQVQNGAIDAYLTGVEKLRYDPKTGSIEIYYNTMNDIYMQGNMKNPVVREMVRNAMLDENSPSVRLHAVKAVKAIAEEQQVLDDEFVDALTFLLKEEQNPGVRLQALRVFKVLPITPVLKKLLIQILLYDKNQALRIEAFEKLTGTDISQNDIDDYLNPAKKDVNKYIRYRANEIINEFQNPSPQKGIPLESTDTIKEK